MIKRSLVHVLVVVSALATPADNLASSAPLLSLRVSPPIAMAPAKITVFAELQGGSDDDPDLYCPTLEWDWDDGSISERKRDCEPFEKGKSKIERRFLERHEYKYEGYYEITLRLKRGDKTVTSGTVKVQIS
ncbi:MAG: hypothetical protein ACE148_03420 [Vicinamibacterales bacterium]